MAPGWLRELAHALDSDRRAVIAGAKLLWPDGRLQNQGWVHWGDGSVWPISPEFAPDLGELRVTTPVDAVSSATMLVDRGFWQDLNGFDEGSFPAVTTEHELCVAAWASGHRVLTVPSAQSVHDTGAMLAPSAGWIGSAAFRTFLIERNHRRLADRWAAALSNRCPAPARIPDTDAVRGALRRTAAVASAPIPRDHWPQRPRIVTGEGSGGIDAPAEVERRAVDLLDERRTRSLRSGQRRRLISSTNNALTQASSSRPSPRRWRSSTPVRRAQTRPPEARRSHIRTRCGLPLTRSTTSRHATPR